MTLLVAGAVDATAPLARRNPVAKLSAAAVLMLALLVSSDLVTPSIVLVAVVAAVPATGLRLGQLLRRTWPIAVGALGVGLSNALFAADPTGRVLLSAGPAELTTTSALAGVAVALRVAAVALPGVLVVASTEPVDLADSLVQQGRVPARYAYGALAALRLLPLLAADWRTIAMARRARGIDAGRNPLVAVRLFAGQVFALLVGAVRRAVRLATAMDARGFDTASTRSVARPQRVTPADRLLVASAVVVAVAAIAGSIAAGTWRFVLA